MKHPQNTLPETASARPGPILLKKKRTVKQLKAFQRLAEFIQIILRLRINSGPNHQFRLPLPLRVEVLGLWRKEWESPTVPLLAFLILVTIGAISLGRERRAEIFMRRKCPPFPKQQIFLSEAPNISSSRRPFHSVGHSDISYHSLVFRIFKIKNQSAWPVVIFLVFRRAGTRVVTSSKKLADAFARLFDRPVPRFPRN